MSKTLLSLRQSALSIYTVLTLFFLTQPLAQATWSIVLVNEKTGEIGIGCATCLSGFDLEMWVPVMRVGLGGGATQSQLDSLARNRIIIWNELLNGTHPKDILDIIQQSDNSYGSRQIGIVDLQGRRRAHTGKQAGDWAGHTLGQSGDFIYSIQGNVLTGQPVVDQAELAVINTSGDLAEKLMAAMEAAAAMGGDGRCSCTPFDPESCGSPPPNFTKSAHVGFMMLSRIGDVDGVCTDVLGCANGSYYLNINIAGQNQADPDPVLQMRQQFDAWRIALRGRPDHILSSKTWSDGSNTVPANGTTQKSLDIALIDWEGSSVLQGGAQVQIQHAPQSAGLATIGSVIDNNDGTYTIPFTAGNAQGIDVLQIIVNDGTGDVYLYPEPTLEHQALFGDVATLSSAAGGTVNFSLHGPASPGGREYMILAALGTSPGSDINGVHIPLNVDQVFVTSLLVQNGMQLVNSQGILATDGSGSAQLVIKPGGGLDSIIGAELDLALITLNPIDFASNPWVISVQP